MKILLTGAAGFIGYHVSKQLLEQGHTVIGIDNLNDYYDTSLKKDRLEQLQKHDTFSFNKIDISEKIRLDKEFDQIVHLAAQAGVRYSIENPHIYEKSNSIGTLNVFEYAKEKNIPKVVFASSSSVYGEKTETPFKETMKLSKPVSLYAATKKHNELQAHVYHDLYDITMVGLRFFTVYGPWGRPDMAPMIFTDLITSGDPIKVFNHGDMRRDFTYVEDIANGVVKAVEKEGFSYEIMNLCNGTPVNLLDFIETLEKHIGVEAEKKMLPMQPGDVKVTYGDNTKAKKILGYEPQTNIDKGVKKFIDWYKEYY